MLPSSYCCSVLACTRFACLDTKLKLLTPPREVEDISSKCIDDAKKLERTAVVVKSVDLHDDRVPPSIAQTPNNAFKSQAVVELTGPPPDPNPKSSQLFPLSSFSADQPRASIPDQTSREAEIRTHSSLLRDMLKLGDYQLTENDSTTLMNLLDVLCRPTEKVEPHIPTSVNAPIEFNDAVGRKFSFPWHLCKTWTVCTWIEYLRLYANMLQGYGGAYKASLRPCGYHRPTCS